MENLKVKYSKEVETFPWVLWICVRVRKEWFSNFWYSRGSNCLNIQIYIWHISIGMPWIKDVLVGKLRDYGSLKGAKETNDVNALYSNSILIGNYKNLKP